MEIWIDAQLSPSLALWINNSFKNVKAHSLRALGLRDADDEAIFLKAKMQNVVLMSKDIDFVMLLERFGPPPQLIWIIVPLKHGIYVEQFFTDILSVKFRLWHIAYF